MEYTYITLTDVIKRIADDDSPRHIRRQLNRLTGDERRKIRQIMGSLEQELIDIEYDELFREAS
jgi:hypothetical protein